MQQEMAAPPMPHKRGLRWPPLLLAALAVAAAAMGMQGAGAVRDPAKLAVAGLLALMAFGMLRRSFKRASNVPAAIVPTPAIVVEKQTTEVDTGRDNGKKRSEYSVRLRREDNSVDDFRATRELYDRLLPGEIGIAYVRQRVLLDYRSVDLASKSPERSR